ncbi:MAG TPA: DUF4870 domain-containing protein [Candidatus Borkfalkia excrementigallinarum]|uniref:DUF4870 domain-containing protein n=1 Tax=Candidatus Borkfalkia excrementigallinarum TaxID=2838506 RepID=A0A9D1ZUZ9_9FIRM|nr:DUF4870 domain-containing protein [Candidatus Borkfalkia excrementigallinarum]
MHKIIKIEVKEMEENKLPEDENSKRESAEVKETADSPQEKNSETDRKNAEQDKESEKKSSADELMQKKAICSLAYLFGILFFLPLIIYPNDEFAKFHANQALVVLLTVIVGEVIFGILTGLLGAVAFLGTLFGILCGVFGLIMLVACILAILGVVREERYELPIIGKIKLIK